MDKQLLLYFCLILTITLNAQEIPNQDQLLQFDFGRSFNGTGDMYGFQYGVTYLQYFNKKNLYWSVAFEGTNHSDEDINYFFEDSAGNNVAGKSRYVVGGMQLASGLGYSIVNSPRHLLNLTIAPLLRYQTSSIPYEELTLFPAITELPVPVQIIRFTEPFRTLSFGGVLKLSYLYTFKSKYFVGLTGGFQTDTNEDSISYLTLALGKRFW